MSARLHKRLRAEGGFTLIEIMVAATLAAVGVLALVSGFDSSREMVNLAERNESATHQAEKELERIMALPYAAVAHKAAPAASPNELSPANHVQGTSYRWDQDSSPRSETLVVDPANAQLDNFKSWSDNRLSGEVHVFVTHVFDTNLVQKPTDLPDARRVTVAVTVSGEGGPEKPVIISTLAFDRGPTP